MPSSDDADNKKKQNPVPLKRQDTSEFDVAPADAPRDPEVTSIEDGLDADLPPLAPGDATAELSQEQLDALPPLQRQPPASEAGPARGGQGGGGVTSDAWGSFEENNPWGDGQTGRRQPPSAPGRDAPPKGTFGPDDDDDGAPGARGPVERVVPARLVAVQAGGGKRQEFVLDRAKVRLGRGSVNQIVIDNPSVSREHARFTWHRGEWTVHDLNSGNGIFVNQQRIAGARALRHGDEVMFGQTLWQFAVESVGVPPMATGPATEDIAPQKSDRGRIVTFGLLAAVVLVGVALAVPSLRGRLHGKRVDPDATAFAALKEGIAAFKAHKWELAERNFGKAAAMSPQDPMTMRLQKAIERERNAEQQLQQAHEAQGKGDLVAAWQLTTGVLDSTFRHEARAFLTALQTELDARVQQAQSALAGGKLAGARELLQAVEEAQPGRPDVAILQVRLALRTTSAKSPVHLAALGRTRQMPPVSGPTAVAVRYFIDGDVPKALQLFESLNSEEAATTRQAVQRFSDAYDAGVNEHRNKRPAAAIRFFNQAKAEEARISHGQCKLLGDIDHKLADMYYVQGLQQFTAGTLPAAYQSLHTAITLVPSHGLATRQLAELDQKAQDILAGSGPSKATRAQLQLVLQIVPVSSELYRKAKTRLDALP